MTEIVWLFSKHYSLDIDILFLPVFFILKKKKKSENENAVVLFIPSAEWLTHWPTSFKKKKNIHIKNQNNTKKKHTQKKKQTNKKQENEAPSPV